MNVWDKIAIGYGVIALLTFVLVVVPSLLHTKHVQDATTVSCPHHFSETARQKMKDYYSTILNDLGSWRKRAAFYKRFHNYCVCWPLFSSWLIPFVGGLAGTEAKWLIVVASGHAALALSFYTVFKIGDNMRAFRFGEPEFNDLNRQLVHQPNTLGKTEKAQLKAYIEAAEDIRKKVRAAEAIGLSYVVNDDNRHA